MKFLLKGQYSQDLVEIKKGKYKNHTDVCQVYAQLNKLLETVPVGGKKKNTFKMFSTFVIRVTVVSKLLQFIYNKQCKI